MNNIEIIREQPPASDLPSLGFGRQIVGELEEFYRDESGKLFISGAVKFLKWGLGIEESEIDPGEFQKLQKFLKEAEEQQRTAHIFYPDKHGNYTYVVWKDSVRGRMRREKVRISHAAWERLEKEKEKRKRKKFR